MNMLRTTCLALVLNAMSTGSYAQSELEGTLFTSPEQRAYLDYLRQEFLARSQERGFDITAAEIPDIPVDDAASEPAAPQIYTLSGIVALRDGSRRIWLNGQALTESELPEGASLVQVDGAPALRFRTDGGSHVVKPGQTLELTAGEVAENFAFRIPVIPDIAPEASSGSITTPSAETTPATSIALETSSLGEAAAETDAIELDPDQAEQLLELIRQWRDEGAND